MENIERITSKEHQLSEKIWEQIEDISKKNTITLIENLEKSVSNGWFSVASEISDSLEASGTLNDNIELRLRVEQERMKRYYCLGFEKATIRSSKKVLGLLKKAKDLKNEDKLLLESTSTGHQGWIIKDSNKLRLLIKSCRKIKNRIQTPLNKIERECFIDALEGRLQFLKKNKTKSKICFEKAIQVADKNRLLRSAAHIRMIYAEHLFDFKEIDKAVKLANEFLTDAGQLQFKTHLLVRAFIILIQASNITARDQQLLFFRYQVLVYAMGLSQSQDLYPLLTKAKQIIPHNSMFDFYKLDWEAELKKKIMNLSSQSFEKLVKLYFELINYKAILLPDNFEAFDIIAWIQLADESYSFTGIQAKSGKSRIGKKLTNGYKSKIRNAMNFFRDGTLVDNMKVEALSSIQWFHVGKFTTEARKNLENEINDYFTTNKCILRTVYIDEFVNILKSKAEILIRLIFSNELEIE